LVRQATERFVHLERAGGTVQADDVGLHRIECAKRGADLATEQHPAGELDGHLHLDRHVAPGVVHGATARLDRRLGL